MSREEVMKDYVVDFKELHNKKGRLRIGYNNDGRGTDYVLYFVEEEPDGIFVLKTWREDYH